jgi:hypothetical protein
MACSRPQNALCHPEIPFHWSVRMKQRRNTQQIQRQLFYKPELSSSPTPLDLPTEREAEIKAVIAKLLLNVVLDNAEASTGAEYDE